MSISPFLPALLAAADVQQGLFTRAQALAAGYGESQIRLLTKRAGPWVGVRRGVYTSAEAWAGHDDRRRAWLRDVAAHLLMAQPHLLSHDSAARAWGLPLVAPVTGLVHVTREGVGGSRTRFGVKHHLGREAPAAAAMVRGVPATGLARTALDVAREHGVDAGVVAIDAALGRGLSERDFERELARMTSWPHVTACRAALAFADGGAESPGESVLRLLLAELGLGPIQTQFAVPVPGGVRWCDLRVGRHVFEFDGRVKYLAPGQGGFATGDPGEIAFRDRARDTDIASCGLGISHVTWDDCFPRREETRARLRREAAVTRDRFGFELPDHLARFDREHPRRRPSSAEPDWCAFDPTSAGTWRVSDRSNGH